MFDRDHTIVGSGSFLCEQLLLQPVRITSPYVKPSAPVEVADRASGPEAARFAVQWKGQPKVYPVSQQLLRVYAEKLIEVSRVIKEYAYDVVLCPMRGARMPGLQSELVCETEPFAPFDGADMAQGFNERRILSDLRKTLDERSAKTECRKIGVLDTAVGGNSCAEMAKLLRKLNDAEKERWLVRFHLIHDTRFPGRATQAYQFSNHQFEIDVQYHSVHSLLFEDEPSLLGYDVARGGGRSHIVRLQQEGQVLLCGTDSTTLFRPAPLDETMIALVSKEIMAIIQRMPDIIPVDLDYWPFGRSSF